MHTCTPEEGIRHQVANGNWTWNLWKSSQCSLPQSHLFSPDNSIFMTFINWYKWWTPSWMWFHHLYLPYIPLFAFSWFLNLLRNSQISSPKDNVIGSRMKTCQTINNFLSNFWETIETWKKEPNNDIQWPYKITGELHLGWEADLEITYQNLRTTSKLSLL